MLLCRYQEVHLSCARSKLLHVLIQMEDNLSLVEFELVQVNQSNAPQAVAAQ